MMVFKLGNSVWSKVALFRKCWFSTEVLLVILMMTMIVMMLLYDDDVEHDKYNNEGVGHD